MLRGGLDPVGVVMIGMWNARYQQWAGIIEDVHVPQLQVTIVGSLAIVHDAWCRIAAVAVVTETYAIRAVSRAVDDA
jgi:hypothetical protein